jgi:hypothetical protein
LLFIESPLHFPLCTSVSSVVKISSTTDDAEVNIGKQ